MSLERRNFKFNNDIFINLYIYTDNNQTLWFKAKEIAKVLGYNNTAKAISVHVSNKCRIKWEKLNKLSNDSLNKWQGHTMFINESGLYRLICRSKMPLAEKFSHWITDEVIPEFRKTQSTTEFLQKFNEYKFEKN